MSAESSSFTVRETHGMLRLPGVKVSASSDTRGGHRSTHRNSQLIVLHLDGPVTVHRRVQKGESSRVIPPGGMFMMPGALASGLIDEASSMRMSTKVLYFKPTVREQAAYCAAQREQQ
jgi:hypothetical protein